MADVAPDSDKLPSIIWIGIYMGTIFCALLKSFVRAMSSWPEILTVAQMPWSAQNTFGPQVGIVCVFGASEMESTRFRRASTQPTLYQFETALNQPKGLQKGTLSPLSGPALYLRSAPLHMQSWHERSSSWARLQAHMQH